MKKRTAALLLAALTVLNLYGTGYTKKDEAEEPSAVKVVTWNIRHGNGRLMKQRDQLKAIGADICFLQEVDEGTDRISGYSCLNSLGMAQYRHRYLGDYRPYEGGRFGSGILSGREISGFVDSTGRNGLDTGHVYGVWEGENCRISIYNVHLSPESDIHRAAQLQVLAEDFFADENPCRIIAGDFNVRDLSELDLFAGMGIVSTGESYYPTYQGLDWDIQAIDNIIYTPDTLRLIRSDMHISGLSDHNALSAEFELLLPAEE
ncbi:MAG: endonuclease/exonuclease/phosphatase family protein [Oscillospiraceae bacterium]|nr:endonuclease/exonuclease/phosphatase family protein [Oscillospiraceae bacterium]